MVKHGQRWMRSDGKVFFVSWIRKSKVVMTCDTTDGSWQGTPYFRPPNYAGPFCSVHTTVGDLENQWTEVLGGFE